MNHSRIIPESPGPYARALTTRRQETGDRNSSLTASWGVCGYDRIRNYGPFHAIGFGASQ